MAEIDYKIGQVVHTFDSIYTTWTGRVVSFDADTVAIYDNGQIHFMPRERVFEDWKDLDNHIKTTYKK